MTETVETPALWLHQGSFGDQSGDIRLCEDQLAGELLTGTWKPIYVRLLYQERE